MCFDCGQKIKFYKNCANSGLKEKKDITFLKILLTKV